jgi:hypothetical protein
MYKYLFSLKTFCFLLLFSVTSSSFSTQPICSVKKVNGGKYGYNIVNWVTQVIDGQACWVGECHYPGREACRPPHNGVGGNSWNGDSTDQTMVFVLLDLQDDEWHDGRLEGTITHVVNVEGENNPRIYRVVWHTSHSREVFVDIYKD